MRKSGSLCLIYLFGNVYGVILWRIMINNSAPLLRRSLSNHIVIIQPSNIQETPHLHHLQTCVLRFRLQPISRISYSKCFRYHKRYLTNDRPFSWLSNFPILIIYDCITWCTIMKGQKIVNTIRGDTRKKSFFMLEQTISNQHYN